MYSGYSYRNVAYVDTDFLHKLYKTVRKLYVRIHSCELPDMEDSFPNICSTTCIFINIYKFLYFFSASYISSAVLSSFLSDL